MTIAYDQSKLYQELKSLTHSAYNTQVVVDHDNLQAWYNSDIGYTRWAALFKTSPFIIDQKANHFNLEKVLSAIKDEYWWLNMQVSLTTDRCKTTVRIIIL
jgi:hypothetical protein